VDSELKEGVDAPARGSSLWAEGPEIGGAAAAVLDASIAQSIPSTIPAPAPVRARKRSRIIAVGGGKGGVGKSLVTSSLGISLARHGRKIVVVDADLGGANLHTCLGLTSPERTLSDFINRRVSRIEDVIAETGVPNLGLISGAHDFLTASNMKYFQKTRLLSRISQVDADIILLDIGAGISFNIVDFFLLAEQGILVVIPEPSSIENAYRFLKMSFYRHLWRSLKASPARKVVEEAMDQKNHVGIRSPFDLMEAVERIDAGAGRFLKDRALEFRPRLLVNQVRYPEDERLGHSMSAVCRKHLGIDMESIGAVGFDESVWRANRKKRPFMLDFPDSAAGRSLEQVARAILYAPVNPAAREARAS
jgi:flagellar biosynthesis protein FlhG